jgi:uncharacterized protein
MAEAVTSTRLRLKVVVLDFNEAYNPYCAFSPYAACPIPPRENHLPIRIAAGATYTSH